MTVSEVIATRKSVRAYKDTQIEPDKLNRVLEAGLLAPSATNLQEWRVVVVKDPKAKTSLATETTNHHFIGDAPAILVVCAETDGAMMKCGIQRFPIDVAIFIDHLTLAAVEEGLGTCWIGGFDAEKVKELLGIPEDIIVVELLPIGYPVDPGPVPKNRLKLSDILHEERW